MSATILRNAPAIAFNRSSDVQIELATDLIDNTQSAAFIFSYASSVLRPQVGDSLTLTWAGHSVTMTVVAMPSLTAPQLRANAYAWELAEFFRNHAVIESDFTVSETTNSVTLTYRGSQSLASLAKTGSLSNVTLTVVAVASPYLQPNLTAYLKVFGEQNQVIGCPLTAPHDVTTSSALFDLHSLFDFLEHKPPSWTQTVAVPSAYTHYYLRFADRYGFPAVIEQLQRSAFRTVLCGSKQPVVTNARVLELWESASTLADVMTTQPNWLYGFPRRALSEVQLRVTLYYSNGVTTEEIRSLPNLNANTVYAIPCGFTQLALTDTAQGSVCLVRYTCQLWAIVAYLQGEPTPIDNSPIVVLEKHFQITDAYWHPWNTYLLVENDCGGCDSIRLYGKKQRKLKAERTIVENADGDLSAIFPQVRTTFDVSTGFYPLAYIEYLKRLLTNRMWLISDNQTFTPVVADSEGFELEVDDVELFALNFAFRIASVSF